MSVRLLPGIAIRRELRDRDRGARAARRACGCVLGLPAASPTLHQPASSPTVRAHRPTNLTPPTARNRPVGRRDVNRLSVVRTWTVRAGRARRGPGSPLPGGCCRGGVEPPAARCPGRVLDLVSARRDGAGRPDGRRLPGDRSRGPAGNYCPDCLLGSVRLGDCRRRPRSSRGGGPGLRAAALHPCQLPPEHSTRLDTVLCSTTLPAPPPATVKVSPLRHDRASESERGSWEHASRYAALSAACSESAVPEPVAEPLGELRSPNEAGLRVNVTVHSYVSEEDAAGSGSHALRARAPTPARRTRMVVRIACAHRVCGHEASMRLR